MRVLFIANNDPRKRYRFLLEPLSETETDVSLFDASGALIPTLVKAYGVLRNRPRAQAIILIGGDIRNFIWFTMALALTDARVVLRFGGDPLVVRDSVERGFRAQRRWLDLVRSFVGKSLTRFMLGRVHGVVVVSDYLLQSMRAALGGKVRALVLAPVIKSPGSIDIRRQNKKPAEALHLLTVTNLNYREKADGVIAIANAIAGLVSSSGITTRLRYDIVGGGYQLDYVERALSQIRDQENVEILLQGKSDRVGEFYGRADIFVYCSTLDGYPLVLCEAQSYGLPIVANRWGAFPDMLNQDEDALFFNTDDPDDIGRVLGRLLEDETLRERLSQGAIANFEKNNSSARCGKRLKQFLEDLTE